MHAFIIIYFFWLNTQIRRRQILPLKPFLHCSSALWDRENTKSGNIIGHNSEISPWEKKNLLRLKMNVYWEFNMITNGDRIRRGEREKNCCWQVTSLHLEAGWNKAFRAFLTSYHHHLSSMLRSNLRVLLSLHCCIWEPAAALCTQSAWAWLVTGGSVSFNMQLTGRSQVSNRKGQRNQNLTLRSVRVHIDSKMSRSLVRQTCGNSEPLSRHRLLWLDDMSSV